MVCRCLQHLPKQFDIVSHCRIRPRFISILMQIYTESDRARYIHTHKDLRKPFSLSLSLSLSPSQLCAMWSISSQLVWSTRKHWWKECINVPRQCKWRIRLKNAIKESVEVSMAQICVCFLVAASAIIVDHHRNHCQFKSRSIHKALFG